VRSEYIVGWQEWSYGLYSLTLRSGSCVICLLCSALASPRPRLALPKMKLHVFSTLHVLVFSQHELIIYMQAFAYLSLPVTPRGSVGALRRQRNNHFNAFHRETLSPMLVHPSPRRGLILQVRVRTDRIKLWFMDSTLLLLWAECSWEHEPNRRRHPELSLFTPERLHISSNQHSQNTDRTT
jgi:hypothetical protein